jgi:cell division protein ZapA
MPQINVTIAGKAYRMACGDGEEPHLEELARLYDGKIQEMREAFGEIGDMRLHVMAALMVADEMTELRRRIDMLEKRLASLQGDAGSADARAGEIEQKAAAALVAAAERIEGVAKSLLPAPAQG